MISIKLIRNIHIISTSFLPLITFLKSRHQAETLIMVELEDLIYNL